MQFTLTIDIDNAAFGTGAAAGDEVARILRKLAGQVEGVGFREGDGMLLRDLNGNRVGTWEAS